MTNAPCDAPGKEIRPLVWTASARETRQLASRLALVCRPGDVVLLAGELGAGKTTFAQGFARGLGIDRQVTSPTFTLVHDYPCSGAHGVHHLLHADLYRLESLDDVVDLDLHELVEDGAVALVEWGDVAVAAFGPELLTVQIQRPGPAETPHGAGGHELDAQHEPRAIRLCIQGPGWEDRRERLAAVLGQVGT